MLRFGLLKRELAAGGIKADSCYIISNRRGGSVHNFANRLLSFIQVYYWQISQIQKHVVLKRHMLAKKCRSLPSIGHRFLTTSLKPEYLKAYR
jgi:hypothetical protein